MADSIRTFSMSGRSTRNVAERPSCINNLDAQGSIPTNAPRCAGAEISRRKARAIARSQSAIANSVAVPTSPNLTDAGAAPVLKKKRGRGCNKGEEAPANRADRRHISLTPLGGWSDEKVPRTIGSHLRTGLKGGYPNWTEMPKSDKSCLWNKFESTYVWDQVQDGAIRVLWEKSIANSLREALFDAREAYIVSKEKPEWCAVQCWEELLVYWRSEKFLKRSAAAKANRSKAPRACHTTGSKSMERAAIDKAKEKGVPAIPYIDNFADTHMKRNPEDPNAAREWIDKKFKTVHDQYVEACTQDFGENRAEWPIDVDAEKWTKSIGSPKKSRVMGISVHVYPEELGFNTCKRSLFSRVSSSSNDSRREVAELKDKLDVVNDKCTQLQAELEMQKTRHDELMELVRLQMPNNRTNQDAFGSSSVGVGGRHSANEHFDLDDLLGEA